MKEATSLVGTLKPSSLTQAALQGYCQEAIKQETIYVIETSPPTFSWSMASYKPAPNNQATTSKPTAQLDPAFTCIK